MSAPPTALRTARVGSAGPAADVFSDVGAESFMGGLSARRGLQLRQTAVARGGHGREAAAAYQAERSSSPALCRFQ